MEEQEFLRQTFGEGVPKGPFTEEVRKLVLEVLQAQLEGYQTLIPLVAEAQQTLEPELVDHLMSMMSLNGRWSANFDYTIACHFDLPQCSGTQEEDCVNGNRINEGFRNGNERVKEALAKLMQIAQPINPSNN